MYLMLGDEVNAFGHREDVTLKSSDRFNDAISLRKGITILEQKPAYFPTHR
jgi:hypothetical protein